MRVASEEKGKVRKGFYIEEGVLEQIDSLLQQVNVKSRNEFLNQALKFYIGYLTSEKIENYMLMPPMNWRRCMSRESEYQPIRNWQQTVTG